VIVYGCKIFAVITNPQPQLLLFTHQVKNHRSCPTVAGKVSGGQLKDSIEQLKAENMTSGHRLQVALDVVQVDFFLAEIFSQDFFDL
jgi:hypothetical protein